MQEELKKIVAGLARNKLFWKVIGAPLFKLAYYLHQQNSLPKRLRAEELKQATIEKLILSVTPDLIVLNGPFRGLEYPAMESFGSTMAPKLIGSYEYEISELIRRLTEEKYNTVIDIGCAEGYYAVGFAMQIPSTTVHAFDISDEALNLCVALARKNHVSKRVVIHNECNWPAVSQILPEQRSLIICDCEGEEVNYFTEEAVALLSEHDLLIELHDFIDLTISETIIRRFQESHTVESYYSVDDIYKAHNYRFPQTEELNLDDRLTMFAEMRPSQMQWVYLKPKRLSYLP